MVMASFKELKNRITPTVVEEPNKSIESPIDKNLFEIEEARYMLNLIANSDFKGRDVQVVYNIAIKLQDTIQNIQN